MNADAPRPVPDYEKTDASARVVALIALGLSLIVAFCLIVASWLYHQHDRSDAVASTLVPNGRFQHGVDEQTGIERAWREQDRAVHEHLDGYGWVDRAAGVVRIPIDRAIDLILAEQKPAQPGATQTTPAP